VLSINKLTYDDVLKILRNAAKKANQALLSLNKEGFEKSFKENDDPVTTGDLLVNTILQEELSKHLPEIGWLSEETKDDQKRLEQDKIWIVDPIDGTKEFVEHIPEFTISVALVEKGIPIIGLILNPLQNEIFTAIKGKGAFLNNKPIHVKTKSDKQLTLLASRSEIKRGEWKFFEEKAEIIPMGSIAYKLALVAAGRADATFSSGPKHEWDIASGCLIVEEAGGITSDTHNQSFIFNQENTLVNSIIGTSKVASKKVFSLINDSRK
jgi:myo-inositol-1(or 4)-monophosphatase